MVTDVGHATDAQRPAETAPELKELEEGLERLEQRLAALRRDLERVERQVFQPRTEGGVHEQRSR